MQLSYSISLILFSLLFWANHASSKRSTYIVHMDKSSMPKAFSTHHYWYSSLLKSTKPTHHTSSDAADISEAKLIYTYDNAFHGFSAVMSRDELQVLKKSGGFVSAYPDRPVTRDTTHSTKFLGLNTATGIWPASQYGKDVIIGIIDSGIWPESPSFKDDGMTPIPPGWKGICQSGFDFNSSVCNKKLIGARYFDAAERADMPDVEFLNSPRDFDGHGTHVASIAAGNFVDGVSYFGYAPGTARGVAPRARIASYKSGSYESDSLAAIDQAVADGVHIISISLSYETGDLYVNPIAAATFGARKKGILVCKSAGNRGPSIATMTAGIPWEVVVASGTVDRWFAGTITLGNGETINGFTTFPARANVIDVPLIYNETVAPCNSTELLSESPLSRIVVCNITDETLDLFFLMGYLANSNARAAIIISEDDSILRSTSITFPATVITPREAVGLIKYASTSAAPTATIDFQQTIIGEVPRPAPALSGSSSRGPSKSFQEILKPDIMAPGVLILAAYSPRNLGTRIGNNIFLSTDYSLESGTSMATPHIAGVAALLKAAHPEWSPAAIQSAMMTTANHLDSTKQPIKDQAFNSYRVASPLGMGSGQVDPNRALDPGLVYDHTPQDLADLVCSMNYTREQIRAIIRSNYNCSGASADLNYPSFIALFNFDQRGMTFTKTFKRSVTNVGNGAATYRMKLEIPENTTVRVTPQTLVFGKRYEKQRYSLSIRYTGDIETTYRQGSLTWIDDTGKYVVRSPIVVSGGVDNYG